jgi:hypothetical protein
VGAALGTRLPARPRPVFLLFLLAFIFLLLVLETSLAIATLRGGEIDLLAALGAGPRLGLGGAAGRRLFRDGDLNRFLAWDRDHGLAARAFHFLTGQLIFDPEGGLTAGTVHR